MMTFPIPSSALSRHIAVVGMTGSGKTSTSKLIVEHVVAAGERVCILDPIKSDWWGITSSSDGKSPGLPFAVLGGSRGHVSLPSSAGAVIGGLVAAGKLPLSIIDMADFEPGGLQRFFCEFAEVLFRGVEGVVHLVIEEAHEFAPKERAGLGNENLAIHWAKRLATAGRSKGIRLMVATQRVQALHNAVLGSCETVVAHRLMMAADQKPVVDWLKNANRNMVDGVASTLSSLPTGTAWLCSGEAQVFACTAFPKFSTYDNTATPTGDSNGHKVRTAEVDLAELITMLDVSIAGTQASDTSGLQKEIAQLKAENARLLAAIDDDALVNAERDGYRRGLVAARQRLAEIGVKLSEADQLIDAEIMSDPKAPADAAPSLFPSTNEAPESDTPRPAPSVAPRSPSPVKRAAPKANGSATPVNQNGESVNLSGPVRRILDAVAFWCELDRSAYASRVQVAIAADYSPASSGFEKALSVARTAGLIDYPVPGCVALTTVGARYPQALTRNAARSGRDRVLSRPQMKVINALMAANDAMTREDLAGATDYSDKSSGFEKVLSQLHTLDIVRYPFRGAVEMTALGRKLAAL